MLNHHFFGVEGTPVTLKSPYRLQIFLPETMRDALRDIAHEERMSLQQLVAGWLLEKIRANPRYENLSFESDTGASP